MTLQLRICFSFSVLLLQAAAQSTVEGRVELADPAKSTPKKRDYSDVAVWLVPAGGGLNAGPKKHAVMLQKDKRFVPHVLVVETGTTIDFPNQDPIFHNAFSNFDGEIFDIGLYPPGTSRAVKFDRSGVVRVFCNIHAAMSAVILAVDTPYFATTPRDGSYAIKNVPPGVYTQYFFHEMATPETLRSLTRKVKINGETVTLDAVSISQAGYLPAVHKNKYGQDYPAHKVTPGYGEKFR